MAQACGTTQFTLLHQFFEAAAIGHPDRIAIEVPPGHGRPERVRTTYQQLHRLVCSLSTRINRFARPDSVIAVLLPRDSHWVYAAQLAVLKSGAAFTCIDASFPDEHIAAVLKDSGACVLLSDGDGLGRVRRSGITIEHPVNVHGVGDQDVWSGAGAEPSPHHLAYIIYTSGTTGSPKGVMIEHHSIVNLVASDIDEFGLVPGDRVGQGSSTSYDSSIEEVWLAFAAGATLVVMDDHTSRLGPDLVPWLRRERISVFCPPPTVLRTTGCLDPAAVLPDLRLLYVGGEALSADLAACWAKGRRMVNGYGPTECTVTVVRGEVLAGGPVTIGQPVRGHRALVLDASLTPVPDGAEGELCIVGAGLARGYRNRPETTALKFPTHPDLGRLYRTGDLVRRNTGGDLEYLGRLDAQVKLRGYRIELEAVEAQLARCPGVRDVACRVQGSVGEELLAAHIVPIDAGSPPEWDALKSSLRRALPAYMVPGRFALVGALPRTVGGKIDRRALPDIDADHITPRADFAGPGNQVEAWIASAFGSALRLGAAVSMDDDFFNNLGGDSLSAVAVICELRTRPETAGVTTRDLYERRTAARLASIVSSRPARTDRLRPATAAARREPARPLLVTMLQSVWLLGSLVLMAAVGCVALFDVLPLMLEGWGLFPTLLLTPLMFVLSTVVYTVLAVAATVAVKWAVIGRYRARVTPVWSAFYLRHWIVEQTARAIPWGLLAGTTALSVVLRMLGAKVGRRVHIHHGVNLQRGGWDLLSIGDDASLGCDSWLGLVELDSGCLHIAPVWIGDRATLEVRAGLSGHARIEADGYLTALSWLPSGRTLPAGERWDGVPAARAGGSPVAGEPAGGAVLPPGVHGVAIIVSLLLKRALSWMPALAALTVLASITGTSASMAAEWLAHPIWPGRLSPLIVVLPIFWMPVALVIKALGVRALGSVQPGVLSRWSLGYVRVWHKARDVDSASRWLSGTLFWPIWLRLAGMRVGRKSEISTIIDVVPECVSVGTECFFADGIYLGGPRVHRGMVTIGSTSIASGSFLGNHVVIPTGAQLPGDSFLGVCTVADGAASTPGTSWFGHPAMRLPRREVIAADRRVTHDPPLSRYVSRIFWESLRFALPIVPVVVFLGWASLFAFVSTGVPRIRATFLIAPGLTLGALAAECLFVLALKWLLLGRARAGQHPLWSCWCSRWDLLYVAWQFYALGPLSALQGTLVLNAYLRGMGATIGRRVVLGPGFSQVVDPDMLNIGDGATVNANFQAHSFEDRVLKLAPTFVRRNATIGENTVVFYGADIGEGAWVAPNGVVMKNETLPPGIECVGCPVQPSERPTGSD